MTLIPSSYQNLKVDRYLPEPKILAFCGPRGAGKTFVARIVQKIDSRFKIMSFAGSLKERYANDRGIPVERLSSPGEKEKYRKDIQEYSMRLKKEHGDFIFVHLLFNMFPTDRLVVIDDLRFIQELQAICMFGGVAYKVHAESVDKRMRGYEYDRIVDEDVSEIELGDISGDTLRVCSGGGTIFNTRDDQYIADQLQIILRQHFPQIPKDVYDGLEKGFQKSL